jgi:hypothetical protein
MRERNVHGFSIMEKQRFLLVKQMRSESRLRAIDTDPLTAVSRAKPAWPQHSWSSHPLSEPGLFAFPAS